ncbi:hypothetical protein [Paraglaciecola arctica]|uniref:Uncharacterized protein n=1 Tax=Paraglaciecola arctica BSs20135 TaxID=493475 RepID=K6YS76_9ALTE|nr:hypothetical protein [Paraglaciecola arctica]GAC19543.1 hypothetical protein GARC_2577 [Paraglaciecola arctica BSs20135]
MVTNISEQSTELLSVSPKEAGLRNRCLTLLQQISQVENTNLDDLVWEVSFTHHRYKNSKVVLDFAPFCQSELAFAKTVKVLWETDQAIELSPVVFAKWLFLELVQDQSVDYRCVWLLDLLKMLFHYLKVEKLIVLTEAQLPDFFSLLLTHDFDNNRFVKRFSIPAYGSRIKLFTLRSIYKLLTRHRVRVLLNQIDITSQNKALNEACLSQTGMTLTDYKAGGSFDFLGLDIGRHYIDYCAEFFEQNITFATAVSKTLKQMKTYIEGIGGLKSGTISRLIRVVANMLQLGQQPKKYRNGRLEHEKVYELELMVLNKALTVFQQAYNECVIHNKAYSLDVLNAVAADLGVKEFRLDTHEFIRAMLYTRFVDGDIKSRKSICEEYKSVILTSDFANGAFKWQLDEFDQVCDKYIAGFTIEQNEVSDLCKKFSTSNNSIKNNNGLKAFLSDVEAAGITLFAAYTGWRASEFGFPLSAISVEINKDIVDSSYTPFRFYVNWTASKTSGDTALRREITQSTAMVANQISQLNCAGAEDPALISVTISNKNNLATRVEKMWLRFPFEYALFKELDELEALNAVKGALSADKRISYMRLNKKYDIKNSLAQEVIKLRNQLRHGVAKLELSKRSYQKENRSTARFSETLRRYKQGTLDTTSTNLLNESLSEKTKSHIFSNDNDNDNGNESVFRSETVRGIREEFVHDVLKVTPHAFRHIWAEAILQRYRGDVGRFIRANFKHIDERFFMAYLRNKEVKSIYDVAKRTTINSVVQKHVASLKDERRSYSGGFDRFVSKAVNLTKVVTNEEYVVIANKIAKERVIDIKSNAWATCILRAGTESHAKCSVDGIPQRHNASPKLCLGCINADIINSNFAGIVIYTQNDVEVCKNPNLPLSIKEFHVATLRKALLRIAELKVNEKSSSYDDFITHLEGVISDVDKEGHLNG